jgi:prepilin-type processing-associated H-X9-DG protein
MKFTSITDGTSNTIMVAEAGEAVIWTKPDDLAYDAKNPVPKLGGIFETGFNVAMCDGSVRFLKPDIDEKLIRALITPQGGEVVNIP